jgi:hypothetical protein
LLSVRWRSCKHMRAAIVGSANREGDWSSPVYIFRPCRHTISYTMPHEKSILWYLYLYFLPLDRIA